MDILIIGNGFDLAHGLKTSYKDFLDFCVERNNKRIPRAVNYGTTFIDNIWLRHFLLRQEELSNTWIDLEEEILAVIETLSNIARLQPVANSNFSFPVMFVIRKDAINFQFSNIAEFIKPVNYNCQTDECGYKELETNDFSSIYYFVKDFDSLVRLIYDKLREFTEEFEKYLIENVNACLQSQVASDYKLTLKTSRLYVLSFNYTNTCESLYQYNCNTLAKDLRIETTYVHGKANSSGDSNLVLGTKSFSNKDIPPCFNIFQKHNQRHKYNTIEPYQELLRLIKLPNTNPVFHIIGHSLDESDHKILKHILDADKNATIKVYYHDEESQERLINNITDIITEEEVMAKVQFIDQHDEKRGILRPVERTVLTSY
ncbi:TPA: bacteriophage abortive infection AbiH family protein [Candidatus Galligastranaerophilus intestinavium]|uniref:Bacteriophage abortive infection AbiH family protein n=1 Tax=Candidatus Galligastranaerophilus intestinavium TaxID=2840836 RepID=A0A9D1FGX0_9BACT|nr:bacteriophage abortive infection AbiH family protein [Candidatus Galligastranaerophilus intestinavium]